MSGIEKRTRAQSHRREHATINTGVNPDPQDTSSSEDEIIVQPRKRHKIYFSTDDSESEPSEDEIIRNRKSNRNTRIESSSSSDSGSSTSTDSASSHGRVDKKAGFIRPKVENESSSDNDSNVDKCPICLAKFRLQEVGSPDSCDHLFCVDCITEWGKNVNTCPVDRSQFGAVLVRAHAKSACVTRSVPIRAGPPQPPLAAVLAQLADLDDGTTCEVCGSADREETLLLCDGCDLGWHMECLTPALPRVPEGEWYCETCARVVAEARRTVESIRRRLLPRTQQTERVRTRVMSHLNRIHSDAASAASAQATAGGSAQGQHAGDRALTARRAVRQRRENTLRAVLRVRKATKSNRRKRKYKRRPKTKRQSVQTVQINYELSNCNRGRLAIDARITAKIREPATSHEKNDVRQHRELAGYRRRKKLRKRRGQRTAKKRAATQLRVCQAQVGNWASSSAAGASRNGIIPPLYLFGQRDSLDYCSDADTGAAPPPNRKRKPTHAAANPNDLPAHSGATITSASSSNNPLDILGTILESQQQFHSRRSRLSLNSDGTLQVISDQPTFTSTQQDQSNTVHDGLTSRVDTLDDPAAPPPLNSTHIESSSVVEHREAAVLAVVAAPTAPTITSECAMSRTVSTAIACRFDDNNNKGADDQQEPKDAATPRDDVCAADVLFPLHLLPAGDTTAEVTTACDGQRQLEPRCEDMIDGVVAAAGGHGQSGGGDSGAAGAGSSDHVTTTSPAAPPHELAAAEPGAAGAGGGAGGDEGDKGGSGSKNRGGSDAYDPEEDLDDDDDDVDQEEDPPGNVEGGADEPQPDQPEDYSMQPATTQPDQPMNTEMENQPERRSDDDDNDDNDDIYSDIETTVSTSQQQLDEDEEDLIDSDKETNEHDEDKSPLGHGPTTCVANSSKPTALTAYDIDDDEEDDDDGDELVIDDSVRQALEEPAPLVSSSTNVNMADDGMDNMAATMERMEQHVQAMLSLVDDNDSIDKKQNDDEENGSAETPHSTCHDKMASENQDDEDTDDDGCPNFNIYSSESVNMAAKLSDRPQEEEEEEEEREVAQQSTNTEDINLPNTQEEEEQLMFDQSDSELNSTTDQPALKPLNTSTLYSDSDEEVEIKIDGPNDSNESGELLSDLNRMTEDISEDDEEEDLVDRRQQQEPQEPVAERSFTPCLDENNMVDKATLAAAKPSCEDLEQISDEENRNDFSGHLQAELEINAKESELEFCDKTNEDDTDEEPQQSDVTRRHDDIGLMDSEQPEKDKQKTSDKIKSKSGADASFKKLSKSNKDRNYRNDKEVDNSSKKRIRDKSSRSPRDRDSKRDKDKENRRDERRRNKERRKELQRYSVRSLMAEKPQVKKDKFGRDEAFRKSKSRSTSKEKQAAAAPPSSSQKRDNSASVSPVARERFRRDPSASTPEAAAPSNRRAAARSSSAESTRSTNRQYIDRMIYDPPARYLQQQQQQQELRSRTPPSAVARVAASLLLQSVRGAARGKKRKGREAGGKRSRSSRSRSKKRRKGEGRRLAVGGRLEAKGASKRGKRAGSRGRRRDQRDRPNKQRRRESHPQHSPANYPYHQHHLHATPPHRAQQQPLTPPLNQSAANRGGDYTPPPLRQLYEPRPSLSSRRQTPPPLNNATNRSWTPPRIPGSAASAQQQQANAAAAAESESLTVILTNDRNKRRERRRRERRGGRMPGGWRDRTPPPSKEVFASGDNILVSVSFNKDNTQSTSTPMGSQLTPMAQLNSGLGGTRRRRALLNTTPSASAAQRQQRQRKRQQLSTVKPVAIIDLDRSPFRELTPSPRDVIVLSDDEDIERRTRTEASCRPADDTSMTTDDDLEDMEDGEVRNVRRPSNAAALSSMCEHHQQVALQQQQQQQMQKLNISTCGPDGDLTSNLLHITTPSAGGGAALSTAVNPCGGAAIGSGGPKTPPEPTCSSTNLNRVPSPAHAAAAADSAAAATAGGPAGATPGGGATSVGPSLGAQIKFSLASLAKGAKAALRSAVNPLHDPDDEADDDDEDGTRDKGGHRATQLQENGATVSTSTPAALAAATSGGDKVASAAEASAAAASAAAADGAAAAEPMGGRGPNTPPNEPPTSAPSSPDVRRCPHNHDMEDNDDTDDDNDKDVYDPFDPTKSRSPSPEPLPSSAAKDVALAEDAPRALAGGAVAAAVDPQRADTSHTPPLVTAAPTSSVTDIQPADSQTPTATASSSIAGLASSSSASSTAAPSASLHRHHHHHHKTAMGAATSSSSGPHKIMAIIDLTPDDQDLDGKLTGRGASARASGSGVGPPLMTPAGKKMAAMAAAQAQQQAAATSISSVLNQIVQVASSMFPSQTSTSVQQSKPTCTNLTLNSVQSNSMSTPLLNLLAPSSSVTSSNSGLAPLNYLPASSLSSSSSAILSSNTAGYSTQLPQQLVSTSSAIQQQQQQQLNPPKINVLSSTILTAAALAAPSTTTSIIGGATGSTTSSLLSTVISNAVAAANANALASPLKTLQMKQASSFNNKPSPLLFLGKNIITKKADVEADSPYSPGSSDYEDLFEPPIELPVTSHKSTASKVSAKGKGNNSHSVFDSLFGSLSPTNKYTPSKGHKKGQTLKKNVFGKTKLVGVKIDEDSLKVMDEVPNSAVEMQVKDKFLKKLNRQERVVEEVKMVLKPHYNKKHITKDEYKDVLRRAVPKICHNKSGEINPKKIQNLIEAYVKKLRQSKKVTSSSSKM